MKDEVSVFLDMKGKPLHELENKTWLSNLTFIVDVTTRLNELNSK